MGRQGDTINRLLKLLDKEAISETYGNDDGTYNATAYTTEELKSVFANYPEVIQMDTNVLLLCSLPLVRENTRR